MPIATEPSTWSESASGAQSPARSRTRSVLVVEDNPDGREMLRLLLKLSGFDVSVAADGLKALEAMQDIQPDVALVDIGLPGIDGYEVARRVRHDQHNEKVYLIALTGYGRPEDRDAILEAGFNVHVVKPPCHEDLVRLIMEA